MDLKRLSERVRATRDRRGRVPNELRREVVQLVEEERATGRTYTELARELGMSFPTLMGWRQRLKEKRVMPVHIRAREVLATVQEQTHAVHGPGGMRIDGMSIADIAELWKRLS